MSDQDPQRLNGDGRRTDGTFAPGHGFSKGNRGNKHRAKLLAEISDEDISTAVQTIRDIMRSEVAKDSDRLNAARELLDRACGKPLPADIEQEIDALREQIDQILKGRGLNGSGHQ